MAKHDLFFFFFKQKTAYEITASDWSSDVCSSDVRSHRNRPPSPAKASVPTRLRKSVEVLRRGYRRRAFLQPAGAVSEPAAIPWTRTASRQEPAAGLPPSSQRNRYRRAAWNQKGGGTPRQSGRLLAPSIACAGFLPSIGPDICPFAALVRDRRGLHFSPGSTRPQHSSLYRQ